MTSSIAALETKSGPRLADNTHVTPGSCSDSVMKTMNMNMKAFSVIELVLAIVILGLVAALAIPQFSRAAVNPTSNDLKTNLAVLRTAIEMYAQDHGFYPGQRHAGLASAPAGSPEAFLLQLTQYSDADGAVSPTPTEQFRFGPYLRDGIPLCPVSVGRPSSQVHLIDGVTAPCFAPSARESGWVYNFNTGYIAANSPGSDEDGVPYDSY